MKYSRRNFLKQSTLLFSIPFIGFRYLGCLYQSSNTELKATNQFESVMLDQPKFTVLPELKKGAGFKIPSSAVVSTNTGVHVIWRIKARDSMIKYESVFVNINSYSNNYAFTTNIEPGDIILTEPKNTLRELKQFNIKELRKRMLKPKLLNN